jgi:hypothetical protein
MSPEASLATIMMREFFTSLVMISPWLFGQSYQQSGRPLFHKNKTGEPGGYASRLILASYRFDIIHESTPKQFGENFSNAQQRVSMPTT